jgi:hypothetical protein
MQFDQAERPSGPSRFDRKNFAVGAVVSAVLVGLFGFGTLVYFQANTPRDEGVNIGGAMAATLGSLLAVALGAAFTARRARRRHGQPVPEGVSAGLTGYTLATSTFITWFFVDRGGPLQALFEIPNMLTLLIPGGAAAYAGAAVGNRGRTTTRPGEDR